MRRYLFASILFTALLCVAFPAFALTQKEVVSSIDAVISNAVKERHADWSIARIKINYKYADTVIKSLAGRKGSVTFAIVDLYPDFEPVGDVIIPVQVYVDIKEAEKIFLRAKVEVWMDIVVASKKLSKKTLITEDDVKLASKDVGGLPKRFFLDESKVIGKELVSSIGEGIVLQDWMVRVPPLVSKGGEVELMAAVGDLSATASGIAMEDGYLGDKVKVRNVDTKREVSGMVSSTGEVSVEIK